jgi:hypothetical protein
MGFWFYLQLEIQRRINMISNKYDKKAHHYPTLFSLQ